MFEAQELAEISTELKTEPVTSGKENDIYRGVSHPRDLVSPRLRRCGGGDPASDRWASTSETGGRVHRRSTGDQPPEHRKTKRTPRERQEAGSQSRTWGCRSHRVRLLLDLHRSCSWSSSTMSESNSEEDLTMSESNSEEEEDDEMMMLVFPALYLASTKTKTLGFNVCKLWQNQ
ncbi:uncharacterized protein LOC133927742 [Phragmites australis]|uniref:uncharacterized protein LOC133927742 n=1 Tax=Phragmites australis TaxID=29695 RepID=UPI002D788D31|nr:uncharacterized protein LOC133927742 [Phragmites australis]